VAGRKKRMKGAEILGEDMVALISEDVESRK